MSCPVDFIQRYDGSCCKPIQCLENQGYKLCSSSTPYTPGKDSCYDCPEGTINKIPTDTFEMRYSYQEEKCRKIDCECAPEAELLNRDECQRTGIKHCVCRRQDLRYGNDPLACKGPITDPQKLSMIRRPGFELKLSGDVAECDQGTFKNKSDDSTCIPHSECPKGYSVIFNGTTKEDRHCQMVTTTVIPLATTVVQASSTPSITSSLRRAVQSSEEEERANNRRANIRSSEESVMQVTPEVFGSTTHQIEDHMPESISGGQSYNVALLIGFGSLLIILIGLVIGILIYCLCMKKKNKKQDLEQDIPLNDFVILQNSGTILATYAEEKDPAEENPLLPACSRSETDDSGGKDDESLETDGDGQYTNIKLHCREVSEKIHHEKVEGYVLHTVDDKEPNSTEEIQIVKERPKEIKTGKLETQQSDQTNVTRRAGPSMPSMESVSFNSSDLLLSSPIIMEHTNLQSNLGPLHSLGSLESNGTYSPFSSTSFDMENRIRYASQDSDYGTGSSRKNDTYNSVSLSSDNKYEKLYVNSLEDSRHLSTETQSSTKTGKSVAVVSPFRRNEMKTVDEEETYSKTP